MNDVGDRFVKLQSDSGDADEVRLPLVGTAAGQKAETTLARNAKPCELPAPTGEGRLYDPPHPIYGIAFVYIVSMALVWGALSTAGDPSARLAVTGVGLCLCLAAAVHWLESVEPSHIAAKLGLSWPPATLWGVGIVGTLPGVLAVGFALGGNGSVSAWSGGGALAALVLLASAVWAEGFHRGFVFRTLMRRHGFLTAAGVSAVLLAGTTFLVAAELLDVGRAAVLAIGELPLSFALCALFWLRGPTLVPGLLVRLSVLAAATWSASAWPAVAASALVLLFLRGLSRARHA